MSERKAPADDREVFSTATLALLKKAGWSPTYHGAMHDYLAAYRDEELQMPRAVRHFLKQFGGLVIEYKTATKQNDVLEFRAERAARGSGRGTLQGYEEMAHAQLSPIGTYSNGMCTLLMTVDGRVYGGTEWSLLLIGSTGREAIERILTGASTETVAENIVDEAHPPRKP